LKQRITKQDRENIGLSHRQLEQDAYRLAMAEQMALLQAEMHKLRDQVSREPGTLQ
jgi:hypothetical protein